MKAHSILAVLVLLWGSLTQASAAPQTTLTKKRLMSDLDVIQTIFEVNYAPKSWKREFSSWDLTQAIADAKGRIENSPNLTLKEGQISIRDFFNSTRDYHVGVRFFSTENATLPFVVKGAMGRYFFCYIDTEALPPKTFPFTVGDEITTFGGQPVADVIEEIRVREFGTNTLETDKALAEVALTQRRGDMGHLVPSGKVEIEGVKKESLESVKVTLNWSYSPERIRDFAKLGASVADEISLPEPTESVSSFLKTSGFLDKFMVAHLWDRSFVGAFTSLNHHSLGARTSFLPSLGKKIWKSTSDMLFDAYIFETPTGKKIGYIRIPHYVGDEEELEEFGLIMNYFEKRTEALVIDQVNNPGGSIFYLYALLATLTDKPIQAPKHYLALTQEEIYVANYLLPYLEQVHDDFSARMILGENVGGYPIDYEFAKLMRQFCNFLISQWNKGKTMSDLTYLFGVDKVKPHPEYRYSKPIVLVINNLDFSGGDFFPAILQDCGRAKIFGTRTAGAGGYVLSTSYPNHSGIRSFILTGSIAERANKRPIENLGVKPDIAYELTVNDLQNDYQEYAQAIVEAVETSIKKR